MTGDALATAALAALDDAEAKAWDSLARYKFLMFGYHAARWVTLNSLRPGGRVRRNPFGSLVEAARLKAPIRRKTRDKR